MKPPLIAVSLFQSLKMGSKRKKPSKHIDELEWMTNIADGIINNE